LRICKRHFNTRRAGWITRSWPHDCWIEAPLSPAIAAWLNSTFSVEAIAVRDLQLRDAKDAEIFNAARVSNAVVMTKDRDFILFLDRLGPPPQIILVTCGNTSNTRFKEILSALFPKAIELLQDGEALVEITAS
jgi:predicted nuclease of predicted toxin-antitoxin system